MTRQSRAMPGGPSPGLPARHATYTAFLLWLQRPRSSRISTWKLLWALPFLLLDPSVPGSPKSCIGPNEAGRHVNKNVCIAAHVYDVVELADGTRFLDVCSPVTADENCRFTIVSLSDDRQGVGDLAHFKAQEVQVRGLIRPVNNRTEMILSREQQFHGGPEKFRVNPTLLKSFSAEDHGTAFNDPALKASHHRGALTRPPRK